MLKNELTAAAKTCAWSDFFKLLLIFNDFCLFPFIVFFYFLYMFCIFFHSFHLDAPTTSPTPTTNPVNTQGTVCPQLLSPLNHVYVHACICVCVSVHTHICVILHVHIIRCTRRERTRACKSDQDRERLWMASFNQIVLLIGDINDRQCWALGDTCHSLSKSHVWSEKESRLRFAFLLSYQHLQLYLHRPIHHIIMPFTSPLQMPVTFHLCEAAKDQ